MGGSSFEPFGELHGHCVAGVLGDRPTELGFDGELVGAVAEGHERTAERDSVDQAGDLDEAARPEVLRRPIGDDLRPTTGCRTGLEGGGEGLVEGCHRWSPANMIEPGVVSSRPVSSQVFSPERIIGQPP